MLISTKAAAYPLGLMLAMAVSSTSSAQTAPAPADASALPQTSNNPAATSTLDGAAATGAPSTEKDIVVTGSRISRRDYVAESPIVTLSKGAIESTGAPTLEQTLNQLPQLTTSASASANFTGRQGQASADLRGLGQQRTLVLIDGKRMQPSSADGTIDLNTIPTQLIDNVEVITGGASAVYGSDAVTGVVNLKLRQNITGVELSAQKGVTDYGDGATTDINLLAGTKFAGGRGRVFVDLNYSDREKIGLPDRPYLVNQATSANLSGGRLNVDASNLPTQAVVNGVFSSYGVAPNTVSRSTILNFNTDGSLFTQTGPVNYRDSARPNVGVYNGTLTNFAGNYFYSQTPLTRYSSFARADFDISDALKVYAQGLYTNYHVTAQLAPGVVGSNTSIALVVPVTNPFVSADLRTVLNSRPQPNAPFTILKRLDDTGIHQERYQYNVYQFQVGASGKLFADWKWDADAAYGRTTLDQTEINYQSSGALNRLLAAPDGGKSLCAGGFNFFGNQPLSADCVGYINRRPTNRTELQRTYVDLNVTGSLVHLPAGSLKFAAGADYRKDDFSFRPDANVAAGDIAGFLPIAASNGSTNVKEIYAELLVPIFRNAFFAKEVNVDAAYRYSDYNSVGGISTYKADLDWLVVNGIRLRGGYSRATRAPSVGELYAPRQFGSASLGLLTAGAGDPCDVKSAYRAAGAASAASVRSLCLAQGVPVTLIDSYTNTTTNTTLQTSGNTGLQAETADTYSAGVVFHPIIDVPLLSRINLSIDYYKIKLKDAVGTISNQLATQRCFNGDGFNATYDINNFNCSLIQRDPTSGLISLIQNPLFNLGGYDTSGIDFAADWTFDFADIGLGNSGRLSLSTNVNKLNKFAIRTTPTSPLVDYAGTLGNTQIDFFADAHPHWKATSSATYSFNPIAATLRWRFIDRMQNANNVNTTATNPPIEAVNYFDLDVVLHANKAFDFTFGIVNLGNRQPPVVNTNVAGNYYTDLYTYDLIGRRFFVSAKARF